MHIINTICFFSILFINCLALKVYKSTAKLKEHNVVSGLHYKNILDQKSDKGRVAGAKILDQTIFFSVCSNFCQKNEKVWRVPIFFFFKIKTNSKCLWFFLTKMELNIWVCRRIHYLSSNDQTFSFRKFDSMCAHEFSKIRQWWFSQNTGHWQF